MANRGTAVVAVTAPLIAIATLFVSLRFFSRIVIVKRVQLDDYFILLAWLIAFGLSFAICYAVKYGLGRHQGDIPRDELKTLQMLEYTFSVLYNPALMATKTSICCFYLSLAKTHKFFKWATIGTLVVVNGAGLALSLLNIFQCQPMSALFSSPRNEAEHCVDIITLYLSSAPVNIITDLAMLLLPMPVLKSMNLPRRQKIILYITFGFGIFVTVVDVIRIVYLQQATLARLEEVQKMNIPANTQTSTDFSWYASQSFMWSAIEVNVGIMCACVPALKPLVSRIMPKLLRDAADIPRLESPASPLHSPTSPPPASPVTGEINRPKMISPIPLDPNMMDLENPNKEQNASGDLDLMDFLTTPDMTELPRALRTDTDFHGTEELSRKGTNYMRFMGKRAEKSIVFMTNKESIKPIAHVTFLFFLWGFAYGLLNTLNNQFQVIANMTSSQSVALHSAYYTGYFLGPVTLGRYTLKQRGFKACYMVGLLIYGVGTLVFWPSAVLTSFPAFFVSNLIVGFGLSILEVAANPFIALCGPPQYAEARLTMSQAIQACGSVVSPLLAKKALFKHVADVPSLIDVQWTYLALTLFSFFLAFAYYCVKLPEVSDKDLELSARLANPKSFDDLHRKKTVWITLAFGVISQFFYVGAQEGVATSLADYIRQVYPSVDEVDYEAVGHTLTAVSRFLAAIAAIFIQPRYVLIVVFTAAVTFSALAMNFNGLTGAAMVAGVFFWEGPLFSYIYALPLHGLGKHTKDGAVLLTAAISGGACIPPIQHAVAIGHGFQYSYCVIVAALSAAAVLPIYLNVVPAARAQVSPVAGPIDPDQASPATVINSLEPGLPTILSPPAVFRRRQNQSPEGLSDTEIESPASIVTDTSQILK